MDMGSQFHALDGALILLWFVMASSIVCSGLD